MHLGLEICLHAKIFTEVSDHGPGELDSYGTREAVSTHNSLPKAIDPFSRDFHHCFHPYLFINVVQSYYQEFKLTRNQRE